jgi:hypothetical protein
LIALPAPKLKMRAPPSRASISARISASLPM